MDVSRPNAGTRVPGRHTQRLAAKDRGLDRQDAMKSEQRLLALLLLPLVLVAAFAGCETGDSRPDPLTLRSPYSFEGGDVLWAVAPLVNESGVSVVDPLFVSDALVYQIQQVHDVSAVPMNRTIAAMRALGLATVDSPQDAVALAKSLGADAIIAGSITAWDPYDPPELGMTLALFGARPGGPGGLNESWVNPRDMQGWITEYALSGGSGERFGIPVTVSAAHVDATRVDIQREVKAYATPRVEPGAPLGWERYTASMALFTEFVCHRLVRDLLESERSRVAQAGLN